MIQLVDANGPVLGPVKSAHYSDGSIAVGPGDILVMYTDGLVEGPGLVVSDGISRAAHGRRLACGESCSIAQRGRSPCPGAAVGRRLRARRSVPLT